MKRSADAVHCFITVTPYFIPFPDLDEQPDMEPLTNPPVPLRFVRLYIDVLELDLCKYEDKKFAKTSIVRHPCPSVRLGALFGTTDENWQNLRFDVHTEELPDGTINVTYLACLKQPDAREFDVCQYSLDFALVKTWKVTTGKADGRVQALKLLPNGTLAVVCHREDDLCITFSPKAKRVKLPKFAEFLNYAAGLVCYWPMLLKKVVYIDITGATTLFTIPGGAPKRLYIVGDGLVHGENRPRGRGKFIGVSSSGALHMFASSEYLFEDPRIVECPSRYHDACRPRINCITVTSAADTNDVAPAACMKIIGDGTDFQKPRILAATERQCVVMADNGFANGGFVTVMTYE